MVVLAPKPMAVATARILESLPRYRDESDHPRIGQPALTWLSRDAVAEMGRKWSVADAELLEPDTVGEHLEEPHPATQ